MQETEGGLQPTAREELRSLVQQPGGNESCQQLCVSLEADLPQLNLKMTIVYYIAALVNTLITGNPEPEDIS